MTLKERTMAFWRKSGFSCYMERQPLHDYGKRSLGLSKEQFSLLCFTTGQNGIRARVLSPRFLKTSHSQSRVHVRVTAPVGGGPEKPPASVWCLSGVMSSHGFQESPSASSQPESQRPGTAENLGVGEGTERSLVPFLS